MTVSGTLSLPRPWLPIVVATYVALALLFVGVVGMQVWFAVLASTSAGLYPEVAEWQLPLLVHVIAIGVCAQAGVVATAVLVSRVRSGRMLESGAIRWVDGLIGTVTVAGLVLCSLVVALRLADVMPPGIMVIIVVSGLGGLVLDLVLLVLRSLLHRAIVLRAELDEVV